MKRIVQIKDAIILLLAIFLSKIIEIKKNKEVWLIGERKGEAGDNGYHFFKYVRETYPEKKCFYIIEKNSKDLNKISELGNVIYYASFKHFLYFVLADKLVMAHLGSCVIDTPVCWKYLKKNKKIRIFIQHGITKEKIESLMYKNTELDLFVCGAESEYKYVKKEFGYPENNVKFLGFCRFDNLHSYKIKKQILIMPTWRQWLGGETWGNSNNQEEIENFLNSEYYKEYNQLLNNDDFINLIEQEGYQVIFYPHQEMQVYLKHFISKSKKIIMADNRNYDVQTLLKESELLITDYSSIAFDFAYMRKQIIYFQFDQKEYYSKHYSKGYFEYERDGFGPVVAEAHSLVLNLRDIINKPVELKKYKERSESFFPLYDNKNCERHYKIIENHQCEKISGNISSRESEK